MLGLLRILFGVGLVFAFQKVVENAQAAPETGDLANAFYLAVCVALAIANAVVWAPYFGEKISDPLTGVITRSTYIERKHFLLDLVRWLDSRGARRLALMVSFLEGVQHPDWPTAFVIGLKNAKPGSWLEKVFAREVFRFDNAQNCERAYQALRRHGIDPRPHHNPEINLLFVSIEREVKPVPGKLIVPPAPELPPPRRNRRIRLFDGADPPKAKARTETSAPAAAPSENPMAVAQIEETGETPVEALTGETVAPLNWMERVRYLFRRH